MWCSPAAAWRASPLSAVDTACDSLLATDDRRARPVLAAENEVDRVLMVVLGYTMFPSSVMAPGGYAAGPG